MMGKVGRVILARGGGGAWHLVVGVLSGQGTVLVGCWGYWGWIECPMFLYGDCIPWCAIGDVSGGRVDRVARGVDGMLAGWAEGCWQAGQGKQFAVGQLLV